MTDAPNAIATPRPSEVKTVPASGETVGALLDVFTDEYSRKIFSSTVLHGRTVDQICSEQMIPVSTCYRKVRHLVDQGLLVAERRAKDVLKRNVAYRSAFTCVRVEMKEGDVYVYLTVNPGVGERSNTRIPAARRERGAMPAWLSGR